MSGGIQVAEIQVDKIDADREVEKIHSLYLTYMDKLETMQGRHFSFLFIFLSVLHFLYW